MQKPPERTTELEYVNAKQKKRVTLTIIVGADFDPLTDTLWAETLGHEACEVVAVHAEEIIEPERATPEGPQE